MKCELNYFEIDPDIVVDGVKEMFNSVIVNPKREEFFVDVNMLSGEELFEKYFPKTMKVKIERICRIMSHKLGVYKIVKGIGKRILRK